MKPTVAIIGWRGMVGSVLVERMKAERDFDHVHATFFSTSQAGGKGPDIGLDTGPVRDAADVGALARFDLIVSCQGGDYTKKIYPPLRRAGWQGYWIDAASTLRMEDSAVIILDPVNRKVIDDALNRGARDFIGGNCTVSLMLMALHGLFAHGWVEWVSSMTYQAASGAGAKNMRELAAQMRALGLASGKHLDNHAGAILELDRAVQQALTSPELPQSEFGAPLAASLIPWIDSAVEDGQTREEWKGFAETNKILDQNPPIAIDGICTRIGSMRCHSQAFTIKLNADVPLDEVRQAIAESNEWVRVVENTKDATLRELTPAAVSGSLTIPVGRIRKLKMGPSYLGAFTVGDQLLWGAAEPLRRMVRILVERNG